MENNKTVNTDWLFRLDQLNLTKNELDFGLIACFTGDVWSHIVASKINEKLLIVHGGIAEIASNVRLLSKIRENVQLLGVPYIFMPDYIQFPLLKIENEWREVMRHVPHTYTEATEEIVKMMKLVRSGKRI